MCNQVRKYSGEDAIPEGMVSGVCSASVERLSEGLQHPEYYRDLVTRRDYAEVTSLLHVR